MGSGASMVGDSGLNAAESYEEAKSEFADGHEYKYGHDHDTDLRRLLTALTEFERVYITKAVADVPKRQYYRVKTVYRHLTKYLPSLPANPNLRYKIKIVREIASHDGGDDDKVR
jgi:hypothetical protein